MKAAVMGKMGGKSLLEVVDAAVAKVPFSEQEAIFTREIAAMMEVPPHRFQPAHVIANELGLMLRKDAMENKEAAEKLEVSSKKGAKKKGPGIGAEPAATVWARLMARTDEMYQVAESGLPTVKKVAKVLCRGAEGANHFIEFGPLKTPVKIVSRARELYADRFEDGVMPEACVTDVIRTRCAARPARASSSSSSAQPAGRCARDEHGLHHPASRLQAARRGRRRGRRGGGGGDGGSTPRGGSASAPPSQGMRSTTTWTTRTWRPWSSST